MRYNWQQTDWPDFRYDPAAIERALFLLSEKTGLVSGLLKGLPEDLRGDAVIDIMVTEAVKTSEIEGEYISREDVKSSIRNQMGLNPAFEPVRDRRANGAAELMLSVRESFSEPLGEEMLFSWHAMLFKGTNFVTVGGWRTHKDPMQVVSGRPDKPNVHFEAPPSARVPEEMRRYIGWFNDTAPGERQEIRHALIRSAIAHLYFESIHPFEDGNGRIGRALSEKALAQKSGPLPISLSKTIESNKKAYYAALENAQKSNEITDWLVYFSDMVLSAYEDSKRLMIFTLQKARLFDRFRDRLEERQLRVLKRMLQDGPKSFEGGMSAKKYVSITGVSKATATRDLQYLSQIGVLIPLGTGRATRYEVHLEDNHPRA